MEVQIKEKKLKKKVNKKKKSTKPKVNVSYNTAPVSTSLTTQTTQPKIRTTKNSHCITHSEFITDIVGSTSTFNIAYTTPINPGLSSLAPWLSQEAINWDYYKFTKLVFRYENRSSTAGSGYIAIGVDYDPDDPAPISKNEMYTWQNTKAGAPWNRFDHKSDSLSLALQKEYSIRSTMVSGELRVYDVGTLYVIDGNQASNAVIGELWIDYTVTLRMPQVQRIGPIQPKSNSVFNYLTSINITSATPSIVNFGNAVYNPLGVVNNAGSYTMMAGTYTIYAQVLLTAATMTNGQLFIQKNGVPLQVSLFPALLNGASVCNVQVVASVIATDIIQVVANITGTTIVLPTGAPAGIQNILQFTPA